MKSWLIGKYPDAGKVEGRRRGQQRMRWLDGIMNSMGLNLSKFQDITKGSLVCCSPWGCKELCLETEQNNLFVEENESVVL